MEMWMLLREKSAAEGFRETMVLGFLTNESLVIDGY
jgi:hypothetical protein